MKQNVEKVKGSEFFQNALCIYIFSMYTMYIMYTKVCRHTFKLVDLAIQLRGV